MRNKHIQVIIYSRRIRIFLSLIFLLLNIQLSFSQIRTSISFVEGCTVGSIVSIPVTTYVKNPPTYNVGAISLTITYDESVLQYINTTESSLLSISPGLYNALPGLSTFKASWFSLTPITLTGKQELFTINFTYLGGCTFLDFDRTVPEYCEYDDENGNEIVIPNDKWWYNWGEVTPSF